MKFTQLIQRRPEPAQSFKLSLPYATHRMKARCEDRGCLGYLNGWKTIVETAGSEAHDIRTHAFGRREFTEIKVAGGVSEFLFPPGQQCFKKHSLPTGRPPILTRKRRGGPDRVHARPQDWNEDFNETFASAHRAQQRG